LLRAVGVMALLALAALTVEARHGLDWGDLADRASLPWARLLAGLLLLALVIALLRTVLRRLRLRRPKPRFDRGESGPDLPPEDAPRWLRALALALCLTVLGLAWWVIENTTREPRTFADRTKEGPKVTDPGDPTLLSSVDWSLLAVVAVALGGLALAGTFLAHRAEPYGELAVDPAPDSDASSLAAAVDAAQAELATGHDPRGSIVAAYRAMAAEVSSGLGARARRSDTPTELLDRAVRSGLVSPGPAGELTQLFREARFSRHPMGEPSRAAGIRALEDVRHELAARRA
jgi:hypothetical protein